MGEQCVRAVKQCSTVGNQLVQKPELEMSSVYLKNRKAAGVGGQ